MLLKEKAIIVSLIVCTAIHSICYAEEAENVISAEFDSEIEKFTYKNIKQALTDVANNENYQLLCECAQWVQSNKDALGVAKVQEFQRLLHQRLSELVGYRDGFLHSHRGAVGLLAIGSIVSTLFYKRKMKFTYYYDAKSSITAKDRIDLSNKMAVGKKLERSLLAMMALFPLTFYTAILCQSYDKMQGDLQIERLNNVLSCIQDSYL